MDNTKNGKPLRYSLLVVMVVATWILSLLNYKIDDAEFGC